MSGLALEKLSFQEMVFKRWINHQLLEKDVHLENLYADLGNGIYIVNLIEVLTLHEFKSKIKNPSFRTQKMENITMALKYIQEKEHIKFLNIDSSNILNKESKIVLSFIWYIIEYFSIIKPLDMYFNEQHIKSPGKSTKQRFMNWLKSKVPLPLKNLTSDCQDGKIIGALVNSFNPRLCSDWQAWSLDNTLENLTMSIDMAEKILGVPPLINANEFVNEKLDEKSMMTYLSQFLFHVDLKDATINAQFIGLDQPSYRTNETVAFSVCSNYPECIRLEYADPDGDKASIECTEPTSNNGRYSFVPSMPGQYTLTIVSNNTKETILSSNISVENVLDQQNSNGNEYINNCFQIDDELDCWDSFLNFRGRGIQNVGIRCGDFVDFSIQLANNQKMKPDNLIVKITSPDRTPMVFKQTTNDTSSVWSYHPAIVGVYEISVIMIIPKLQRIFQINVGEKCSNQIIAFGPGLSSGTTNSAAIFVVETNGETGTLNFTIEGPNEAHIDCTDNGDGSATVAYWPTTSGEYAVHILYDNEDIKNSPFMVDVKYPNNSVVTSMVKAYGPALCDSHLTVGQMAHFTVDVAKVNEILDLIAVDCFDRFGKILSVNIIGEGAHKRTYSFTPLVPVKLTLCISYDGISIHGSPFMIYVTEESLSNKIRVQGSGLQSAIRGSESVFFVDCRLLAGDGDIQVIITDSNLNQVSCIVEKTSHNVKIYSVKYTPLSADTDQCFIEILYDNVAVYDRPLMVAVSGDKADYNTDKRQCGGDNKSDNIDQCIESLERTGLIFHSSDYSDIFLDPKAESYLRLLMPPDHYKDDISLSDLPLPPADLIDDGGDTSPDILPTKFPLSTVIEESEDTYSMKDSLFTSESHSRASAKEDNQSLSRRSSITLTQSQPDHDTLIDESVNQDYVLPMRPPVDQSKTTRKTIANVLPPIPKQSNVSLAELSDVNEFDDMFPLPAPPLETEMLCNDEKKLIRIGTSRSYDIKVDIDETEALNSWCIYVQCMMVVPDTGHQCLRTYCCSYELGLPTLVVNSQYSQEIHSEVEAPMLSDAVRVKQDTDYESVFVDEKIESEMSFSEMLPVTQMEVIISPYDGASNYLSDNSDNSLVSDNFTSMVCTAHVNQVNIPIDYLRVIDVLQVDTACLIDQCIPTLRLIKEITTSEVSEISETSQWVSNDDRVTNCNVEETETSLSDINVRSKERFHNTNNCKSSNLATKWTSDQSIVSVYGRSSLIDGHMCKDSNLARFLCTQVSEELDLGSDSFQSLTFPEPPSDLFDGSNLTNNLTNKSTRYKMEDIKVKASMSSLDSPCAYLKTCGTGVANPSDKLYASINKPLLASSEICFTSKSPGDLMLPIKVDVDVVQSSEPINDGMDASLDALLADVAKSTPIRRRRLQGKRRSLSQTNSERLPYLFDPRLMKNNIAANLFIDKNSPPDVTNVNKQHVRAFSESDQQRINTNFLPEESIPTKQERTDDKIGVSKDINLRSSLTMKETILRRQLPNMSDAFLTNCNTSHGEGSERRRQVENYGDKPISSISVYGEGLTAASCGVSAEFLIRTSGNGTGGISLAIEGPSKTEISTITLPNGDCKVVYIPKTPGEYSLSIQQNGSQIVGSPFQINVSSNEISKPSFSMKSTICNAYAEGQGLSNAYINYPNQFTIYTKDSGPGGLSLSIEGPSKAFIEFQEAKNGACGVTYRVTEPGLYTCITKFNKIHIRNSPISINVASQPIIAPTFKQNRCTLDKINPIFQIGKRAIFNTESRNIKMAGITKLVAILYCPLGSKKQLVVHKDQTKECVWVEFIPFVEGRHHLHFMDESKRNDPISNENSFVLMVEEPSDFNQVCFERELRSIKVYGKGLVKGRAGYSNIFFIEIGESVSGALNVTVDGPSKVEIKCNETDKGFKFSYIPGIPGDYLVTIKYGGEKQIKGSPFQVKISTSSKGQKLNYSRRKLHSSPVSQSSITEVSVNLSSDSSTITCFGSGLQLGKVNTWMDFYVDASKTKTMNHLFVGLIGPSEPCEEIRICYMDNRRFLISYKARERGRHSLVIKWGDSHISSSPGWIQIE